MRLLHAWKPDAARFDDEDLVSAAGLVPVLALAEQTQLPDLVDQHVRFDSERIASAAANPVGKIMSIIAGMLTGADSIADLQVIRSGGSAKLFGAVYAPSTLGMFLRELTHGHTRQLSAVLARHPAHHGAATAKASWRRRTTPQRNGGGDRCPTR